MKTIPKILDFVVSSLRDGETEHWLGWYNNLRIPDKKNVGLFLAQFHGWMSTEAENREQHLLEWTIHKEMMESHQNGNKEVGREIEIDKSLLNADYFIVSAIGSTARGKNGYGDVDLLIVTNRIWRDMSGLEGYFLEQRLAPDFHYEINPTVPEAYQSFGDRPDRTLITLNPKKGTGKRLHITLQPEVMNEEYWEKHDAAPKIVLYRAGDTSGYCDDSLTFEDIFNFRKFIMGHLLSAKFTELMGVTDTQLTIQNSNERADWSPYEGLPDSVVDKMKRRALPASDYAELTAHK